MVTAGFLLYPRRQAVYRPPPFQLQFTFHNLVVQNVTVSVGKIAPNRFYLDISVPGMGQKALTQYGSSVFWTLEVPARVTSASCSDLCNASTSRGAIYSEIDDGPAARNIGGSWIFERKYILRTSSFAWNENGLSIEGQLPIVQFYFTRTNKFLGAYNRYLKLVKNPPERLLLEHPTVSVNYYVADARSYDWVGGPQPNFDYIVGRGLPLIWDQHVSAMTESVAVSGINTSAAEWDNRRTLGVGVLFGIAGGALIGAIQEATQIEWGHSRSRKSRPTRSA